MNSKLLQSVLAMVCVLSLVGVAGAALTGPGYPAPGGNVFGWNYAPPTVTAVAPGGVNYIYSGFDSSAFTDLYWGAWDLTTTSATLDGTLHNLTSSGVTGNTQKWTGTTSWYDHYRLQNHANVPIELQITITGTGSWVSATSLGLARPDYLWNTNKGSNYTANLQFLADAGSGMQALNTFAVEDYLKMQANFSGGFYSSPAVPEPATIIVWSLLGGLGIVLGWRRRMAA
jgi:hypothetical protein